MGRTSSAKFVLPIRDPAEIAPVVRRGAFAAAVTTIVFTCALMPRTGVAAAPRDGIALPTPSAPTLSAPALTNSLLPRAAQPIATLLPTPVTSATGTLTTTATTTVTTTTTTVTGTLTANAPSVLPSLAVTAPAAPTSGHGTVATGAPAPVSPAPSPTTAATGGHRNRGSPPVAVPVAAPGLAAMVGAIAQAIHSWWYAGLGVVAGLALGTATVALRRRPA